jgi:hypothetical protein
MNESNTHKYILAREKENDTVRYTIYEWITKLHYTTQIDTGDTNVHVHVYLGYSKAGATDITTYLIVYIVY